MTEEIRQKYNRWLGQVDGALRAELNEMDNRQINDAFFQDLTFGTGGLRGIIGAGTNRMNVYTVRRATQGLADYLNATAFPKVVAIAHDSRHKGKLFSREAAKVLTGNGIQVLLYPRLEPTPALSWAVRYYNCGAGICITASHNPAKYNGYKVYGADGCQITLEAAKAIYEHIQTTDTFYDVKIADFEEAVASGMIRTIPDKCLSDFVDAVIALRPGNDVSKLRIVYTPLNGSGLETIKILLDRIGIRDITVVPEQEEPDGDFPTCPYPNPEIHGAMERGLELCKTVKPDLLIGTDPDCDRMGVAVADKGGEYQLISGNEMGVLLFDYICKIRIEKGTMPDHPVAVTTIVSTDMAAPIAERYGVELRRTLTGFKYIGEQIGLLEAEGYSERFIFGFEESYGYLSGTHVRDKDAVNATMLVCEAAAWYRQRGMSLLDGLNELYEEYGWYKSDLLSFNFEGAEGMKKIQGLMRSLRQEPPSMVGGFKVVSHTDYETGQSGLIPADVLAYRLEDGAKAIVRPSGTEPKLKLYLSVKGRSSSKVNQSMSDLGAGVNLLIQQRVDSFSL